MRSATALVLALLACGQARLPEKTSSLQTALERAADLEGVPRPLLVALAYADSRFSMNGGQPSIDGAYGLLHLVDRPDAPDALSLARAARLTGLSPDALRTDPFANARGGAALLRAEADKLFAQYKDLDPSRLGDWWQAVMRLSGNDDARVADSFASQVYRFMRDGLSVQAGGELVQLAPQEFETSGRAIWGRIDQSLAGDYCPNGACVAFVPASSSNFNTGRDQTISMIVIHDMEGSYAGSIGWFQNPSAGASAHYCIRSSDGEITQMVHDADTAWHSGNHLINNSAIGIEHEGFAHDGAQWYTEAMYKSSAALARWLSDTLSIPKDRTHIIGHYEVPDPNNQGWFGGAHHHHDPCDTWAGDPTWHNTVACYWDWSHYMNLVSGVTPAATGVLTGFVGDACCGLTPGARKPLPGAVVSLAGTSLTATVDASGHYTFTIPAGTYTPQASMGGYADGDHTSIGPGYAAAVSVPASQTTWASIFLHSTQASLVSPVVKITSPADGATLSASPAAVQGTVSDAALTSLQINGAGAAAANGSFTATVPLTAGDNSITVSAVNSAGRGAATIHVRYAPPAVQTGVQGRVSGPSGAIAGAGLTLSPGGAHGVSGADGSYQIAAAPGAYTLAVDANGFEQISQAVAVQPDKMVSLDLSLQPAVTAPHIRIDSPREGQIVEAPVVMVSGVAEVQGLASLSVQGETVASDASGAFSVAVDLKAGANQIVVSALTADGRAVEGRVEVELASSKGCSSAPADLMALFGLLMSLRARRRR